MNSKDVGEKSEGQILAALLRSDKKVLIPFGDNQRYDMVIDEGDRFIRVQCKTARLTKKGVIAFQTCSSSTHRGGEKKNYKGQADLFGIYCPPLNKVYFIPVDNVGDRQCFLRLERPLNGQKSNIRWAKDYEFDHNGVFDPNIGIPVKERMIQNKFDT